MNNLEKASNAYDVAKFIVKALHGIATDQPFTKNDAKDAVNAIGAVAKLGYSEDIDFVDFTNALQEFAKSGMDFVDPKINHSR